ncbi:hypothetical protein [Aestuariivivens marinum]|uniref:hypothetical protein n=1 Tax=Aestuariivivens marinum TaxID=2913555 RepID=UPI001F56984C|nr:hypothetical protein [Aestuariivivens marinum]
MTKKLVVVFIAVFAIHSYSQEGTASPYSFYGIGSLKFKGTVENRSMGGLSVYTDSIHVNLRNPASYTGSNLEMYGNEGRPVKFTVGGSYSTMSLKSDSSKGNASSTTFDYIALSVPLGKFGMGFGLLPYTAVGYKLEALNANGGLENRFTGQGGVNKAFLGFGYQFTKELSIGVDAHYNFGNTQNSIVEFRYDDQNVPLQYQTRENNRSDLSGLNFNLGLSYKAMFSEKLEFVSGFTLTPKSNLTSQNKRSFSTITINSNGDEFVVSQIETDLEALGLLETKLTLPSKFSFGAGIGEPRKWFMGAEYTSQKTSEFNNPLYQNTTLASYEDASTISIGGFFIPQYNTTSYLKRTVYRAGLRFEKTGLLIKDKSIKEFGISFGVGLPVGEFGDFSNANFGVEIGKRGTTNSHLIQEDFINFRLSLSLNDRWFMKRKYN